MKDSNCTECGKSGANLKSRDAGNMLHYFHPSCFAQFRWWINGHDNKVPKKYRDAAEHGVHLPMPLKPWSYGR